jgi:hypothetical protein
VEGNPFKFSGNFFQSWSRLTSVPTSYGLLKFEAKKPTDFSCVWQGQVMARFGKLETGCILLLPSAGARPDANKNRQAFATLVIGWQPRRVEQTRQFGCCFEVIESRPDSVTGRLFP